ncbi:hypothetical protein IWW38_005240, partial [Coemansia aciculifera]
MTLSEDNTSTLYRPDMAPATEKYMSGDVIIDPRNKKKSKKMCAKRGFQAAAAVIASGGNCFLYRRIRRCQESKKHT